jgi:hypothetical protein
MKKTAVALFIKGRQIESTFREYALWVSSSGGDANDLRTMPGISE